MNRRVLASIVMVTLVLLVGGAVQAQVGFKSTTVLQTTKSVEGQPIQFPSSRNQITVNLFEIAPGGESPRHLHPVPPTVYVLEGTLTMEADGYPAKSYIPGQAFVESTKVWHKASNRGTTPMRALIVFSGEEGTPFTVTGP